MSTGLKQMLTATTLTASVCIAQTPGDAHRGKLLLENRQQSLCVLCHAMPLGDARQQGNIGPDLAGIGSRLTREQLRARLVDSQSITPGSVMPSYGKPPELQRVAKNMANTPIFNQQQLDDVLAYLETLR